MNTNIKLNIFESLKSKSTSKYMELDEVLELIKNGDADRPLIEAARLVGKGHNSYKLIKDTRLSISWNSTLNEGRKLSDFKAMTGFIYVDKDNLSKEEIDRFKSFLMTLPYLIAVWVSFGGKGLGCLINIKGVTKENFLSVWNQINEKIGIGFDDKVKSITNMNVISYDPDIRVNYSSTPFPFTDEEKNNVSTTSSGVTYFNGLNDNTEKVQYGNIYTPICVYEHNTPFEKTSYNSTISYHTMFPEEIFEGAGFKVFPETVPYYKANTFITFSEGGRNQGMFAVASNLFKVNPTTSKQSVLLEMYQINKLQCKPPLLSSEISKIVNCCYKKSCDGTLYPTPGKRTIVFDDSQCLDLKEKRKIIGKEVGKLRRNATKASIQAAINSFKKEGKKITQKDVALATDKSIKTIKNHWSFFKVDITGYNKSVRVN